MKIKREITIVGERTTMTLYVLPTIQGVFKSSFTDSRYVIIGWLFWHVIIFVANDRPV